MSIEPELARRTARRAAWITEKVANLLKRARKRGIGDDVIVEVFGEVLQAIEASVEETLNSLKELTGIDEDDGSDPAYA